MQCVSNKLKSVIPSVCFMRKCIRYVPVLLMCIVGIGVLFKITRNHKGSHEDQNSNHKRMLYNLMEDTPDDNKYVTHCTLEYVNIHKLQQDHPCVLSLIKENYLMEPVLSRVASVKRGMDPSAGQSIAVLQILRNLTNGFFIESGAADGFLLSNSFYLENNMNWTGLLIEPNPHYYNSLAKSKRKSWTVNSCLSLENYPTKVSFSKAGLLSKIESGSKHENNNTLVTVQCFPLYSILLAHGRKKVDFFSLDVEGHELKILKTIPWHKVDITLIIVEWEHIKEGYDAVVKYMSKQGYIHLGSISTAFAKDIVFIKDFLAEFRYDDEEENNGPDFR